VSRPGQPEVWHVWLVPALALAAAAAIVLSGSNRPLFLAINAWSSWTGIRPWPLITVLGDTAVAIALLTPILARRPDIAWALVVGSVVATLFVHGCKPFFSVPRPPAIFPLGDITVIGPAHRANAFPSGHTTTIFLAAGLLCLHYRNGALWVAALGIATAVGLSRSVVGVHWPLDILAGAAGGWVSAAAGMRLSARWPAGRSQIAHGSLMLVGAGVAVALLWGLDTGYPEASGLQRAIGASALLAILVRGLSRLGRSLQPDNPQR
jgi:membrane-associated phospholipid phosphatase